jgi:DNA primase
MTILRAEADRLKASVRVVDIIGQSVAMKRQGRLWTACCPFHAEKTPSFWVYPGHYHCFGCGAHGDVFDWLMRQHRLTFPEAVASLGGSAATAHSDPLPPAPNPTKRAPAVKPDGFLRCWHEGLDQAGTLVEAYLRHRGGLSIPEGAPLRFHPRCQRGARDLIGGPEYWPAMLALMTSPLTGDAVGVHRTYLAPNGLGKAPDTKRVDADGDEVTLTAKRILGTWGLVRLEEWQSDGIGLAEGIETALAVSQRLGWHPVWAAGSRGTISSLPVLEHHALTIFADGDKPGREAAAACAARWTAANCEVWVHTPPEGQDWDDASRRLAP